MAPTEVSCTDCDRPCCCRCSWPFVAVAGPPAAAAQNVTGTISGVVLDEQKQPVPGATVTVINEATSDARVTTTDGNGDFQVTNLLPGSYTVRVEMDKFRRIERTKNVLSAAERLSIGALTLQVGALNELRHRRSGRHTRQHN